MARLATIAVQVARQTVKLKQLNTVCLSTQFRTGMVNISTPSAVTKFVSRSVITSSCLANRTDLPDQEPLQTANREDLKFRNIYTFRYIVHTKVVSRLKIYQTLLTVGAVPVGISLHQQGILSTQSVTTLFGVASFATVMLYVMSIFFRRAVGIISISESEDIVRISHLTFWGKRNDVLCEISDIVPLSDMSVKSNDIYQVIQFYEKPTKFYWFLRHGNNTDAEAIQRIFGKI